MKPVTEYKRYPFTPSTFLEKMFFGSSPKEIQILKHPDEYEMGFLQKTVDMVVRKHSTMKAVFLELRQILRNTVHAYLSDPTWQQSAQKYSEEFERYGYSEELLRFWAQRAARFGFVHLQL